MEQIEKVSPYLDSPFHQYLFFGGLVLFGILFAFGAYQILKITLKRTGLTNQNLLDTGYRGIFVFMVVMIIANGGLVILDLPPKIQLLIERISHLILIYSVAHFLIKSMAVLKLILYNRFNTDLTQNLEQRKARTQIDFLQKTGTVVIIIIAVAIALMSFAKVKELGTSILASAGLAGIVLGFAAQKSISNLLAGFQIAFTQPIRIDDVVVVENEFGKIEEISLTYVVVKIWNEKRLILPISYFIDQPFQNLTRNSSELLDTVMLYADHTLPIGPLRIEVQRILENEGSTLWDKRVGVVQVTDCTEFTIQIRILISASNASDAFSLRSLIREKAIEFIRNNYPDCLPKRRYLSEGEVTKEEKV